MTAALLRLLIRQSHDQSWEARSEAANYSSTATKALHVVWHSKRRTWTGRPTEPRWGEQAQRVPTSPQAFAETRRLPQDDEVDAALGQVVAGGKSGLAAIDHHDTEPVDEHH